MVKNVNPFKSFYSKAYIRDDATKKIYTQDAMLIGLLAHVHGNDRDGRDGTIVRNLLEDINL